MIPMVVRAGTRGRVALAVLGLLTLAAALQVIPAAAEGDVTWTTYDVTVDVQADGSLHVTEAMTIAFDGVFSEFHARIPLDRIERIENVKLQTEDAGGEPMPSTVLDPEAYNGEPNTFTTDIEDGEVVIDAGILPTGTATEATETRTIVLDYDALGAIRVSPNIEDQYQEVRWTAIGPEVSRIGDIETASATITFPDNVPADQLRFDPEPEEVTANSATWRASDLSGGDALRVLARFPSITDAMPPAWQADAEALDRQHEREDRVLGLAFIVGPAMAVAFGLLMLFMRRTSTRNAYVGLVADVLPEPPNDLPAGLVGALIDRSFDARDAVAMLVDFDWRGIVELQERPIKGKSEIDPARFQIILRQPVAEAAAWERPMLEGLFGNDAKPGKEVTFTALKTLREKHQSAVAGALERELFERGFYEELPHATRTRWMVRALGVAAVAAAMIGAMALWTGSFPTSLIVLAVFGAVLLVLAVVVANWSTVKTVSGEEETATWKAFARYLEEMERGMPIPDRLALVDRFLPWAVALGFDRSWKVWMQDPERGDRDDRPTPGRTSGSGTAGGRSWFGGLQDASDHGLWATQSASGSVFAMLNAATSSFNAGSSSSSSGGGGSSSVGSSGGGSRGFS